MNKSVYFSVIVNDGLETVMNKMTGTEGKKIVILSYRPSDEI
jgi:hypothetical protein